MLLILACAEENCDACNAAEECVDCSSGYTLADGACSGKTFS